MNEYQKTGKVSTASLRADLDPKTGRKYIKSGRLPSAMNKEHTWRTRADPFEEHWLECVEIFNAAPELKTYRYRCRVNSLDVLLRRHIFIDCVKL